MSRNTTLILVAVLCLGVGAAGFWLYQDSQRSGIDVNIGGTGITVQTR